ncbi:hypothetical protein P7K49_023844, partial [Saguinus oedipus]
AAASALRKPGHRSCPPRAPALAHRAERRKGEKKREEAAQQLRPGRCRKEERGAQPRPLVTRCHLLLPRRRRAQTMAARAEGRVVLTQSRASADTYSPAPRSAAPLGPFTQA